MNNTATKRSNPVMIVLIVAIIVLLAIIVLFLTGAFNKTDAKENDLLARVNQINDIKEEDRQAALDKLVADSEINITYASDVHFTGALSDDFMVRNIDNNHYPIVFKIFDENGALIYESQPIPIGSEMTAISLKEPLSEGVHECKISIGYDGQGNVSSTFPLTVTVAAG